MKRIYTYIILMACAMLFASCQKDFDGILTAEIEQYQGNSGKVYIDGENFACWHDGDKVWMIPSDATNGIAPYGRTLKQIKIEGNRAIIQNCPPREGEIVRSAYYATSMELIVENGTWGIYIIHPQTQSYREQPTPNGTSSVQVVNAPMIGQSTDGRTLQYRNAGALMKVTIPNTIQNAPLEGNTTVQTNPLENITITSIKLIAETGKALSGHIAYTNMAELSETQGRTPSWENHTTLSIENGYGDIVAGENNEKSFYIAIPPVKSKFKVEIIYTKGENTYQFTSKESSVANSIARNTIVNMTVDNEKGTIKDITFGRGDSQRPYLIYSYEQLSDLMQGEGLSKCYKLMDSITLPTDFAGFGNHRIQFTGTFDGGGFTITNGTSTNASQSGVFENVAGCTIKNLKVNANINTTNFVKGGLINNVSSSTNPTTIENCIVDGSINSPYLVGGLIGTTNNVTLNLKRCINSTNITSDNVIGGLIGNSSGTINITDCVNKGDMIAQGSNNGKPNGDLGGLIGNIVGGPNITIQNSYVLGTLISNSILGGIIGKIPVISGGNATITIENVYIDPDLTQTTIKQDSTCAIVGAYTAGNSVTFNCTNVFVPNSFIQTNEAGGIIKKLYGVAQPGGDLKDNVTAIPDNLLERLQDGQYGHADWSAWVDDVIGNGTNQPGLDFEGTVGQP